MLPKRTIPGSSTVALGIWLLICPASARADEPTAKDAPADRAKPSPKAPSAAPPPATAPKPAPEPADAGPSDDADKPDASDDGDKSSDAGDGDQAADSDDGDKPGEPDEPPKRDGPVSDASDAPADPAAVAAAEARAKREDDNPRPAPLTDLAVPDPPSWARRLEIGADIAVVIRPLAEGVAASQIGYRPALGWGLHLDWPVLPWLRVRPYFLDSHHLLDIPQGALSTSASSSISPQAQLSEAKVETFVFGAKLSPTLDITDRFRVWLSAGMGWGRFEFQDVTATEPGGGSFVIRKRAGTMLEFPLGLGLGFDIWPRWVTIQYEATAAPFTGQAGSAYESAQALDADGQLRDVGPLGAVELSIVQTLGVSLIL